MIDRIRQKISDWWDTIRYHMDPDNCLSYRYRLNEWCSTKLAAWLTPWNYWARTLFNFCINDNGTKLLDHSAHMFYVRSRDGNSNYFEGTASLFGYVRITRTQWKNSAGEPQNTFMIGVAELLTGEKGEELKEETEVLFEGRVLTRHQWARAVKELMRHPEFEWYDDGPLWNLMIDLEIPYHYWWACGSKLDSWIMARHFPGKKHWVELTDEESKEVQRLHAGITAEDAKAAYEEVLREETDNASRQH